MRAFNRLLSLLLGMLLVAVGTLAIAELLAAVFGRPSLLIPATRWADVLRDQAVSDTVPLIVFGVVGAVALVLLVLEVRPWPKRRITWATDDHGAWWLRRRSVEDHIASGVVDATSATGAEVILRAGRRRWSAEVLADAAPAARPAIQQRAEELLTRLAGERPVRVEVRLRRARRAA
jgi:hypothetical protein